MADDKSLGEIVGNALKKDYDTIGRKVTVALQGEETTKKFEEFEASIKNDPFLTKVGKRYAALPEQFVDAHGALAETQVGNLHKIGTALIGKITGVENDGVISSAPQTPAKVADAKGKGASL